MKLVLLSLAYSIFLLLPGKRLRTHLRKSPTLEMVTISPFLPPHLLMTPGECFLLRI